MVSIQQGATLTYQRQIRNDDIRAFAALSGDHGHHHVHPDETGRLVAHGLLVISVATRLGSDIHYLAHTMTWMFIRPVFGDDTITATIKLSRVQPENDRLHIQMQVRITNQDGRIVTRGESTGVITHPATVASYLPPATV
jgi:3-hydroxybutyryl-CoA dehydratase